MIIKDTGLQPNTTYDYFIKAKNGEITNMEVIDTLAETTPINLHARSITDHSAVVTWDYKVLELDYDSKFDVFQDGEMVGEAIESDSFRLADLKPETDYKVKVRHNRHTEFSEEITVTTRVKGEDIPLESISFMNEYEEVLDTNSKNLRVDTYPVNASNTLLAYSIVEHDDNREPTLYEDGRIRFRGTTLNAKAVIKAESTDGSNLSATVEVRKINKLTPLKDLIIKDEFKNLILEVGEVRAIEFERVPKNATLTSTISVVTNGGEKPSSVTAIRRNGKIHLVANEVGTRGVAGRTLFEQKYIPSDLNKSTCMVTVVAKPEPEPDPESGPEETETK